MPSPSISFCICGDEVVGYETCTPQIYVGFVEAEHWLVLPNILQGFPDAAIYLYQGVWATLPPCSGRHL